MAVTVILLATVYTRTYDQLLLMIPIVELALLMDYLSCKLWLIGAIFPIIDLLVGTPLFLNMAIQHETLERIRPQL
jgi:hypothetical protein